MFLAANVWVRVRTRVSLSAERMLAREARKYASPDLAAFWHGHECAGFVQSDDGIVAQVQRVDGTGRAPGLPRPAPPFPPPHSPGGGPIFQPLDTTGAPTSDALEVEDPPPPSPGRPANAQPLSP